jgi:hypothetical protein
VSIVHRATDIRIFHKQCRTLAAAGYDVILYARAEEASATAGVRIRPVPAPRSRLVRMTSGVWSLLRPLLAERADVYHFHDPELIPLGFALRARGRTVVFDAHEPLPDQILAKHWIPRRLRPVVAWATRLLVGAAGRGTSAVVAASPLVAGVYAGARNLVTVNNFPILARDGAERPLPEGARADEGARAGEDGARSEDRAGGVGGTEEEDRLRVVAYGERPRGMVYVGGISDLRGLSCMLEVARIAGRRHGEKLTLIGPFTPPELEARLNEPDLAGVVDYVGVLPPDAARRVIGEAKVGLILQLGPEAYKKNLPTKMFEYMAEGLPVVASDFPVWRAILAEADAGVVVDPEDGAAAAEAVSRLLADPAAAAAMGERGRRAVHTTYSWETEARTLLALYADLIPPERRPDVGRPDAARPDAARPDAARPDAGRHDVGLPSSGLDPRRGTQPSAGSDTAPNGPRRTGG